MVIEWNDNLKTGIAEIDEQHRQLFKTLAKLDKLKETETGFKQILLHLQVYVSHHFRTEEEYMKYTDYPDYLLHKSLHDKFLEDYKLIIKNKSTASSVYYMQSELVSFVENWMNKHYTDADVKMAAYIIKCHPCP